jgi:hypothetical protein
MQRRQHGGAKQCIEIVANNARKNLNVIISRQHKFNGGRVITGTFTRTGNRARDNDYPPFFLSQIRKLVFPKRGVLRDIKEKITMNILDLF